MRYIDLFAGAGGLSEGFVQEGFQPIAHVEYDRSACFTLRTRTCFHYLKSSNQEEIYTDYLAGNITRSELYNNVPEGLLSSVIHAEIGKDNDQIFSDIDRLNGNGEVDLILGGPPCQAYSVVGRAVLKDKENDPRKTLYIEYGRFLRRYTPKIFIFENVPGILSSDNGKHYKNLKKYYRHLGYEVDAKVLNARDFGVIQNRKRVIIIGWRSDIDFSYPTFEKIKPNYFRDDIFSDLEMIKPGHTQRLSYYASKPTEYLKKMQIRNGFPFVTQHITRPQNERDLAIYDLAVKELNNGNRLRNDDIPANMRTQKNVRSFLDRFKVVGKEPHTMIAHIAKDGHHYIHPDKEQNRSISIREAARIQSFSDDYYFEGIKEQSPRTAAFRQIGNAVPPILSKVLANGIRNKLKE